jgi:hypothetical protein
MSLHIANPSGLSEPMNRAALNLTALDRESVGVSERTSSQSENKGQLHALNISA